MADQIVVEQRELVDGGEWAVGLRGGSVLHDDSISSPGHGVEVGMLEGSNPGIGGDRVQQHDLKKLLDVGEETKNMVEVLRGKPVSHSPGVKEFASQLPWRLAEMADEGVASSCVGQTTGSTDDGVDYRARVGSKER